MGLSARKGEGKSNCFKKAEHEAGPWPAGVSVQALGRELLPGGMEADPCCPAIGMQSCGSWEECSSCMWGLQRDGSQRLRDGAAEGCLVQTCRAAPGMIPP